MNRSALILRQNRRPNPPSSETLFAAAVRLGRDITRQIAIAEREGDFETVLHLLREKDRVHRLRGELADAC